MTFRLLPRLCKKGNFEILNRTPNFILKTLIPQGKKNMLALSAVYIILLEKKSTINNGIKVRIHEN